MIDAEDMGAPPIGTYYYCATNNPYGPTFEGFYVTTTDGTVPEPERAVTCGGDLDAELLAPSA